MKDRSGPALEKGWVLTMPMGSVGEFAIWSGMAGVLLVLCLVSTGDWLIQRSAGSARGLAFVLLPGGSSVLLSGLPEWLFPTLTPSMLLTLKVSCGPLGGALALHYLGMWVGSVQRDPWLYWIEKTGCAAFAAAAVVLAWLALPDLGWSPTTLIAWAAAVNAVSVLMGLTVALRSAALGDALARWMLLACVCLAVMTIGLYTKALGSADLGLWAWALTALATVAYFLIAFALTFLRNRELKRLQRLAEGIQTPASSLSLPQGSALVPLVEAAVWRSRRMGRPCVIAAISVRNLYDLSDNTDFSVETQIIAALAARIRRHVGFRNVVGLYHQRCFVLAVSDSRDSRRGELLADRLLGALRVRVPVTYQDRVFSFTPDVSLGVVNMAEHGLDAHTAIYRAEHLALASATQAPEESDLDLWTTQPPIA